MPPSHQAWSQRKLRVCEETVLKTKPSGPRSASVVARVDRSTCRLARFQVFSLEDLVERSVRARSVRERRHDAETRRGHIKHDAPTLCPQFKKNLGGSG